MTVESVAKLIECYIRHDGYQEAKLELPKTARDVPEGQPGLFRVRVSASMQNWPAYEVEAQHNPNSCVRAAE